MINIDSKNSSSIQDTNTEKISSNNPDISSEVVKTDTRRAVPSTEEVNLKASNNKKQEIDINEVNFKVSIENAVEDINQNLQSNKRTLEFSIDENTGTRVVLVKDSSTGQVIRSIPSEEMQKIMDSIEELKGIMYEDLA